MLMTAVTILITMLNNTATVFKLIYMNIIYYAFVTVLDVKLFDGAIYLQGLGGLVTRMLRFQGFFKNLRILKDSPWGRKRHKCIFPR